MFYSRSMKREPTSKLYRLRAEKRLSLRGLSRVVGVGYRHLYDLEHGSPGWPKARARLAKFFGVPEDELFEARR